MLDHLPDVADLARCAAVARAWRETVRSSVWPRARRMRVRNYGDGTPVAIAWAAQRCRNLTEVRFSDVDLEEQCRFSLRRHLHGARRTNTLLLVCTCRCLLQTAPRCRSGSLRRWQCCRWSPFRSPAAGPSRCESLVFRGSLCPQHRLHHNRNMLYHSDVSRECKAPASMCCQYKHRDCQTGHAFDTKICPPTLTGL